MPLNRHITPERKLVMRNSEDNTEIIVAPTGYHDYEIHVLHHDLSGEVKYFEGVIKVEYKDTIVPGRWDSKGVFSVPNKEYDLVFSTVLSATS